MLLLPLLDFPLLLFTLGRTPFGIKLGIINDENVNCKTFARNNSAYDCIDSGLSCLLINEIAKNVMNIKMYDSYDEIFLDAIKGKIGGFVHIGSEFSAYLINSQQSDNDIALKDIHMKIRLDGSSIHIHGYLNGEIVKAYDNFIQNIIKECNFHIEHYANQFSFKNLDDENVYVDYDLSKTLIGPMYYL